MTIFVNEEGLLQRLPLNLRATLLWRFWVPAARYLAVLAGDAILIGPPDPDGNTTDLPEPFHTSLLTPADYHVKIWLDGLGQWFTSTDGFADYFDAIAWGCATAEQFALPGQMQIVTNTDDN